MWCDKIRSEEKSHESGTVILAISDSMSCWYWTSTGKCKSSYSVSRSISSAEQPIFFNGCLSPNFRRHGLQHHICFNGIVDGWLICRWLWMTSFWGSKFRRMGFWPFHCVMSFLRMPDFLSLRHTAAYTSALTLGNNSDIEWCEGFVMCSVSTRLLQQQSWTCFLGCMNWNPNLSMCSLLTN